MDALDVAIIRETSHPRASFQWNVRESYRGLAEAIGVDEETVRLRMRRLQDEGLMRGLELVLNPSLLGRVMLRIDLPHLPPGRKPALLEQARLLDGIRWIFEHYEDSLGLVLFCERSDIARQTALVEALAGCRGITCELETPPSDVEPTQLDWRILRALRPDPRRAYHEIAAELGVSSKTVRRRVERLIEGHACFMSSVVDLDRLRGGIAVEVLVQHAPEEDPETIRQILRSLPHRVFERHLPRTTAVSFFAFSMREVDEVRRRLAATPHAHASVRLLLGRHTVDAWLDTRIEREIAQGLPAASAQRHAPPDRGRASAKPAGP